MRSVATVLVASAVALEAWASSPAPFSPFDLAPWIVLIVALGAIWFAMRRLRRQRHALDTEAVVGQNYSEYLLQVLVNAAKLDGAVNVAEREAIVSYLSQVLGAPVEQVTVNTALSNARLSKEQLIAYLTTRAGTLTAEQKLQLIKGVLTVIAADGVLEDSERETLIDYIEAMGFDRKQAPSVLTELIRMPSSGNYV